MADQQTTEKQTIELTVSIPIELMDSLQQTTLADAAPSDLAAVTEAMYRACQYESAYHKLTLRTFDGEFVFWYGDDWKISTVWGTLSCEYGIQQEGRKLSWDGEEMQVDKVISDFHEAKSDVLYIVPGDFFG